MITHTTNRLRLRIRDKLHLFISQRDPLVVTAALIAVPLLALILGTALYRSLPPSPLTAIVPTPGLIILIATAQPQTMPTPAAQVAAVLPNTLSRAVVAYDAPDGTALGAIEQGRAYAVLARYGADWLQADVTGSGVVWLKADQVLDLPFGLADLQPPPMPAVVFVSAPAALAAPPEAAPTPAPSYAVTSAPAAPISERQQNIQGRLVDPNVAQAWAAQQWRDEHCVADRCIP